MVSLAVVSRSVWHVGIVLIWLLINQCSLKFYEIRIKLNPMFYVPGNINGTHVIFYGEQIAHM